ncbi:hypothetical protein FIBSPDRAFT_1042213 [Athelia psychrophila]|uniref:DUF7708 domain-containing protein n=1 Tax=Athelia psychrophila TaxID=1759441 RepID=A0A166MY10_9AGAM|nr:hypothetical protein FIBSPDRAFT_1042213 [Fibularhizoctonia sp. CBS 109695]
MSQNTQDQAGGSSGGSYDLRSIYQGAIDQLQGMRDAGQLSPADYDLITSTSKPDEILLPVGTANASRISASVEPLLSLLEGFGAAMELVMQFSPEFMGVNILGIVWGSIKFMMARARDVSDALDTVAEILDVIRNSLPTLEVYTKLFGSSDIQLLKRPLVEIYTQLMLFGVQGIKLFDRSMLSAMAKSTSTSQAEQFRSFSTKIAKARDEVDRIAIVEHMNKMHQDSIVQESERLKAEKFRTEIRQRNDHSDARTEGHPLPSLRPFNDAVVDLISSCFTGRVEDIQFIADAFASPTGSAPARCAVWGMPGLGKSQLGLKYAHSSFELGRHKHIFAISATTVEKLTQGLVAVLNLVQHPERHNSDQAAQLTAARHSFENSDEYGFVEWLIIFDNATSETVAFLLQHFPRQNSNGRILITTRTLEIAEALTNVAGRQHPVRELKALSTIQSAELLLKKAGISSSATLDVDSAKKLVERMGCLPLAVEQAGAMMKQSGFKSADRLNNLYDEHRSREIIGWTNSLTNYEEKSVMAAFTAPLQQLGANNPDVLSFLRVLVCLDPESIPLDILVLGAEKTREQLASTTESTSTGSPVPKRNRFSFRKFIAKLPGKRTKLRPLAVLPSVKVTLELIPLLDSICSEEWLRKACGHLKDFSLAQPLYGEKTSLHIHDLIQQVVAQQTTAAHKSSEDPYHALAVTLLSQAFPTKDDVRSPQSWAQCERVVPHVMSLVNHIGALPIGLLGVLSVRVAWYFMQRGRYEEAVALCQQALEGQTQQLGAEHLDTLATVHCLAGVDMLQGRYDSAEALYQRALAGMEQQLGADHRATLDTVNGLAILYWRQGGYDTAEPLYQRALTGQEQQLGADHPDTLHTVHGLATLYDGQKRYKEAEALYQRALAGQDQQLGADHPDTLATVGNLAILYYTQENYNEAQPLYQRALAGYERQLGPDHPRTLATVNNLAGLYGLQGNHVEAEALYRRALAGRERQLGPDHPDTLTVVHNIAALHESQGKYDEAEMLYKRALAGKETTLGIHHPSTIITREALARVYGEQGRDEEAKTLLARAEEAEKVQLSK